MFPLQKKKVATQKEISLQPMKHKLAPLLLGLFLTMLHASGTIRLSLNNLPWKLSLDMQGTWQHDRLYLPPVSTDTLPVHLPTGGWDALSTMPSKTTHLPATIEQHFWGYNGSKFGVTGNYVGVSWFSTEVLVPETMKGKRIFLHVESARFRTELFVNHQLAGYDLINGTPFEFEITRLVKFGQINQIDFRITDPNGNFNWKDSQNYMWGDYRTIPTHGFGGITGNVCLEARENLFIEDVFIRNKPTIRTIDVEVSTRNLSDQMVAAGLRIEIKDHRTGEIVFNKVYPAQKIAPGTTEQTFTLAVPGAKLWSVNEPNLYELTVSTAGERPESFTRRFGFRWFEVRDSQGNRAFYLNGKRIVLRTAISWSFWPDNGIFPDDSLARKQVVIAKKLGLNMLNFHRTIGYSNVLDYADELGLLYFEEPGGNSFPAAMFESTDSLEKTQTSFYLKARTEKLCRMIRRDRNHPSLIIYNLHNERGAAPQKADYDEMRAAHTTDPTRILTYNSCNGSNPEGKADPHFKTHLLPYDTTFHAIGWWDEHHAGGPGTYHDFLYKNAQEYHRGSKNKTEIVYWGEEGAIGTPPRLELIRNELIRTGKTNGWEADDYLQWFDAYDRFLTENPGFRKAFPTVDHLTLAMGNVAYYYQGRMIENIRINNVTDGYAINGWESMKLENHSGIVDNYRNPKGDVELIAHYNQPLYIAVKIARKVIETGSNTTVDFHLVNEQGLKGTCQLSINITDEQGKNFLNQKYTTKINGGDTYGQLLYQGCQFKIPHDGYFSVNAQLTQNGKTVATGTDKLIAISCTKPEKPIQGMVADTSGVLSKFMQAKGIAFSTYKSGTPKGDYLLVGAFEPSQWGSGISDLLEWVYSGHTLIVVNNAERWAEYLADKEVVDYRGSKKLGTSWYGGNYVVKNHPLFDGLPQACAFNWEYQCFATYNRKRTGLRLNNGETVVACVSDHKKEVYSALSIFPAGRGKVILCALDIFSCIHDLKPQKKMTDIDGENASMNTFETSGKNQANIVGQRLLMNMLQAATPDKMP